MTDTSDKSRVAVVRGDDRHDNVRAALDLLGDTVDLAGRERIVIKPNFVVTSNALAATHREAVRAVLEYLWEHGVRQATLAEGCAEGSIRKAIDNYGYGGLVDQYKLDVVDLNHDEAVEVDAVNRMLRPTTLRVARTVVESDLRISVCPPKTHDTVQVTLSLKNVAVGSILPPKRRVHQGHKGINLNLYKLARVVGPHLAVLDGYEAMEGNGPVCHDVVDWRLAVASADFVAADSFAAQAMGYDIHDIGYLYYCHVQGLGRGDLEQMEIVGNTSFERAYRPFKRHVTNHWQTHWRVRHVERYL